jgi:hypothetical protein
VKNIRRSAVVVETSRIVSDATPVAVIADVLRHRREEIFRNSLFGGVRTVYANVAAMASESRRNEQETHAPRPTGFRVGLAHMSRCCEPIGEPAGEALRHS